MKSVNKKWFDLIDWGWWWIILWDTTRLFCFTNWKNCWNTFVLAHHRKLFMCRLKLIVVKWYQIVRSDSAWHIIWPWKSLYPGRNWHYTYLALFHSENDQFNHFKGHSFQYCYILVEKLFCFYPNWISFTQTVVRRAAKVIVTWLDTVRIVLNVVTVTTSTMAKWTVIWRWNKCKSFVLVRKCERKNFMWHLTQPLNHLCLQHIVLCFLLGSKTNTVVVATNGNWVTGTVSFELG